MTKTLFASLLSGIMGSILFITIHNYKYQKKMGVVNIKNIMSKEIEKFGSSSISKSESAKKGELFSLALEQSIEEVTKKNNIILFVSGAVVKGVPDFTKEVEKLIREKLK